MVGKQSWPGPQRLDDGDAQWAAELATLGGSRNKSDAEARALKAEALRVWAYNQKTPPGVTGASLRR